VAVTRPLEVGCAKAEDMLRKNKRSSRSVHAARARTRVGRSVFHDLFDRDEATELEMRSMLLMGVQNWISQSHATARALRVSEPRLTGLKRGRLGNFDLATLVRLAARAGLRPKMTLRWPKVRAGELSCRPSRPVKTTSSRRGRRVDRNARVR
jgi:predicted XRE-type DNA-binding protein